MAPPSVLLAEPPTASRDRLGQVADRRTALARGVLAIARRALPADRGVELALAGDVLGRVAPEHARVTFRDPWSLARSLWPPTPDTLAEAYLRGDMDIDGDIAAAVDAARSLDPRRIRPADVRRLGRWLRELLRDAPPLRPLHRVARLGGRRHSRARDLAAVRFHYDVGNDFFELWLDRRLTYSCAYFASPGDDLDAAQEAKLDLTCRKLGLRAGMRLLDIGCGWGSLALFAAERHGVDVVGITLSENQATRARFEAGRLGIAERVRVEVLDYRDLGELGAFDAVASVGMFEHVGRRHLAEYFAAAWRALRPGGLFLNHGIATTALSSPVLRRWVRFGGGGFVGRYVFPDGELVAIEDATGFARRAGFEVTDVESLRPHYALTLAGWVRRLEASREQATIAAGDEVYRTWRLYMTAARRGFEDGSLDVLQSLLLKPLESGPAPRPLRPWWWA